MQQTPSSLATATGKIDFPFTNDFVFRAILQRNKRVLTALICAIVIFIFCYYTYYYIHAPHMYTDIFANHVPKEYDYERCDSNMTI